MERNHHTRSYLPSRSAMHCRRRSLSTLPHPSGPRYAKHRMQTQYALTNATRNAQRCIKTSLLWWWITLQRWIALFGSPWLGWFYYGCGCGGWQERLIRWCKQTNGRARRNYCRLEWRVMGLCKHNAPYCCCCLNTVCLLGKGIYSEGERRKKKTLISPLQQLPGKSKKSE